jgi:hypothetical protein
VLTKRQAPLAVRGWLLRSRHSPRSARIAVGRFRFEEQCKPKRVCGICIQRKVTSHEEGQRDGLRLVQTYIPRRRVTGTGALRRGCFDQVEHDMIFRDRHGKRLTERDALADIAAFRFTIADCKSSRLRLPTGKRGLAGEIFAVFAVFPSKAFFAVGAIRPSRSIRPLGPIVPQESFFSLFLHFVFAVTMWSVPPFFV